MRFIVFDTETTGLPKNKKASVENSEMWPYIVQISWMIYDDVTGNIPTIRDYIVKLPNGMEVPEESTRIHGISTERMLSDGLPIKEVLNEFTRDLISCQMLIAHNIDFDSKVIQAEYCRNELDHFDLDRHVKIEYCTMKYGKKFTNILRPSKFHNGTYQKPPKLIELHKELFKSDPNNLHNSLVDVFVCFRCFHQMVFQKDIFNPDVNKELSEYYHNLCNL